MRYFELIRLDERIEDVVKTLSKYKDDDDVFISFRSIPKLGINPSSHYDTPIGIYAYPLKRMWTSFERDAMPFAGDMPYIVVFRATGFIPDVSPTARNGYTDAMLERDLSQLKKFYLKRFADQTEIDYSWGNFKKYSDAMIAVLAKDPNYKPFMSKFVEHILREPDGVEIAVEDWNLTKPTVDKLKALCKDWDNGKPCGEKPENMDEHWENLNFLIDDWMKSANMDTPSSKLWNVTRNLALIFAQRKRNQNYKGNTGAVIWTGILRNLGYEGFTDRTATGQIHSNEPCQAVFFSPKPIKLVEIVRNVRKDFTLKIEYLGELTSYVKNSFNRLPLFNRALPQILMQFGQLVATGKTDHVTVKDRDVFRQALAGELPGFIYHLGDKVLTNSTKFSVFSGFAKWYLSEADEYRSKKSDSQFIEIVERATYYNSKSKLWQRIVHNATFIAMMEETPNQFNNIRQHQDLDDLLKCWNIS
jgi:hypothetical protein